MAFTLVGPKTIDGVTNSYEVTGNGNLDDLQTTCAGIGFTRNYQTYTYSPGANRVLAVSGTLTEDRDGVRTVNILGSGHICWAYAVGSVTTLGKKDTASGAYISRVDVIHQNGSLTNAAGDQHDNADPGRCCVGAGTFNGVCGSISYCQPSRMDLDIANAVTLFNLDNFTFYLAPNHPGGVLSNSYTHMIKAASKFQTTALSCFVFARKPMEAPPAVTEVSEFYTNFGIRWVQGVSGTTIRFIRPKCSVMDGYQCGATSEQIAVDPVGTYLGYDTNDAPQYQFALGIKKILRTIRAFVTDAIGQDISSSGPQPKLVILLPAGTTTVVNFASKVANYEALQSTRASGADHSDAGLGWTAAGNYSAYVVGYGYEEQWLNINPVTAHAGNAGIIRSAALPKNPLAVTAYASVVTVGFSLDTVTDTISVTAARTTQQVAEYLLKLAYDNADAVYWRTLLHSPVVAAGDSADFGHLDITCSGAGIIDATVPIITTGQVRCTLTAGGAYSYTGKLSGTTSAPTLEGGLLSVGAAGAFLFDSTDTILSCTPTAPGTYSITGTHLGTIDLRNTSGTHAITIQLPTGTTYTTANNTGAAVTVIVTPYTLTINAASIPDGSTVGVFNEDNAMDVLDFVSSTSGGYSVVLIEGIDWDVGDTIVFRALRVAGVTATMEYDVATVAQAANATFTVSTALEPCVVYNTLAINGASISAFDADYIDTEVDVIVASNFAIADWYAWWKFNLTTVDGMQLFWGGITPIDVGNFQINDDVVSIFFDNTTGVQIWATDNRRVFRKDGARPIKNPTTGGGGIDLEWREKVLVVDIDDIAAIKAKTDNLPANPADVADIPTAVENATAVGDGTVVTGWSRDRILRKLAVLAAAKTSGNNPAGGTVTFRTLDDTADEMSATVDANGNRTAVTQGA